MAARIRRCALCALVAGLAAGCSSPLDPSRAEARAHAQAAPQDAPAPPPSAFRPDESATEQQPELGPSSTPDDYIRYALFHSPSVESAYHRWLAAAERLPQVSALPDPRLSVGFFLDEVETRVGAQQARIGVQQTFPWPGELSGRKDAAAQAARAAWRQLEGARLVVTERVVSALHDLAYLDAAIGISRENLDLLGSFEEVVRARYRVGAGSHPELIRVQVELGQQEDRLAQLQAMRPSYIAQLNSVLNRRAETPVPELPRLPGRVVAADREALVAQALESNPTLLALDDRTDQERILAEVARTEGLPDLTVGLDYTFTDEAIDSSIPESGDDPILLSFGVTVPLWRDKYNAAVREALSRRLSISYERASEANRIAAALHRAWFEHTDADRRVRLYEQTLIPKAEESLQASLAGFRTGETSFLDLLDTERTLLEFALAAERARADRGKALAVMHTLIGAEAPTQPAGSPAPEHPSEETP